MEFILFPTLRGAIFINSTVLFLCFFKDSNEFNKNGTIYKKGTFLFFIHYSKIVPFGIESGEDAEIVDVYGAYYTCYFYALK